MTGPLRRVLGWLRPYRGRMALAAALQAGTVSTAIGLMAASAWLISSAALHPSIATLQLSIVGVRFFGLSRGVLRYVERLVAHDLTLRILATLRIRLYAALDLGPMPRLAGRRSGDVLARLGADVETLEGVYVRVIGPTAAAAAVTAIAGLLLWRYHGWLALAGVGGLIGAGVLVPWLAWRLGSRAGGTAVALRADVGARLVDAVQGSAELTAFGTAAAHARTTADTSRALGRAQETAGRAAALGGVLTALAADLTAFAVLAIAVALVPLGGIEGVNLAVVALATFAAFEGIASLPAAYQGLGAVQAAAHRVAHLLDDTVARRRPAAAPAPPQVRTVEIRDLTFAYPGAARPALRGLTLRLEPARPVALVGPSGAGKSTLAHLLLRFWDPPAGTIRFSGVDVLDVPEEEARGAIAFVAQRTHLFAATLRENLRLARPDATDDELLEALGRAGLLPFVRDLPDGLGTWLGEQGLRLSGGERQRLAFARALLKRAPVLVLDEPTSHLDPAAARAVLDEIYRESATRAVLLITHQHAGLDRMAEIIRLTGSDRQRGEA